MIHITIIPRSLKSQEPIEKFRKNRLLSLDLNSVHCSIIPGIALPGNLGEQLNICEILQSTFVQRQVTYTKVRTFSTVKKL